MSEMDFLIRLAHVAQIINSKGAFRDSLNTGNHWWIKPPIDHD
jgi:hypothetical protein